MCAPTDAMHPCADHMASCDHCYSCDVLGVCCVSGSAGSEDAVLLEAAEHDGRVGHDLLRACAADGLVELLRPMVTSATSSNAVDEVAAGPLTTAGSPLTPLALPTAPLDPLLTAIKEEPSHVHR